MSGAAVSMDVDAPTSREPGEGNKSNLPWVEKYRPQRCVLLHVSMYIFRVASSKQELTFLGAFIIVLLDWKILSHKMTLYLS
jgi:hypothetical protein